MAKRKRRQTPRQPEAGRDERPAFPVAVPDPAETAAPEPSPAPEGAAEEADGTTATAPAPVLVPSSDAGAPDPVLAPPSPEPASIVPTTAAPPVAPAADLQAPSPPSAPPRPALPDALRQWWSTWIWRPASAMRRTTKVRPAAIADADAEAVPQAEAERVEEGPIPPPYAEPLSGYVYLVPISHLDTQWRWTVRETAARFLPETVRANAEAFERYPAWRVNFDGAFRYALLAEHDPAAFAELRRWVDDGRWKVAGGTWDALDVNIPGAESFVRHVLQGRRWFRQHLRQDPRDLFLPDCFGFGAQVPVLAAHCGLTSFFTSKLRRPDEMRSAFGVPFPVGWWQGADGSRLLAVLDPGGYGEVLHTPPAEDFATTQQLRRHRRLFAAPFAVRFFGIGDKGGVPDARSLQTLQRAADDGGAIQTQPLGSDEAASRVLASIEAESLPVHRSELLLTTHGPGCYTSQTRLKRWNARNESLAAAAERAATAAAWLGAPYPAERLRAAWRRFLWHQFHDDLTGTSIPAAYRITVADEAIAASVFAATLRDAVAHVARGLDTTTRGVPVVVFNPLPRARRELVAVRVPWSGEPAVTVVDPEGEAVAAQLEERTDDAGGARALVRFVADLPPLGFAVFDVRPETAPATVVADPELRAHPRALESGRYRLRLDAAGFLVELFDRELNRELLAEPLRLEVFADRSPRFPAWELHYEDLERGPLHVVDGPATIRALPGGPAAIGLEVSRKLGRSTFVERYRLGARGAGDRLDISIRAAWRHRGRMLKATFATGAGAHAAVYDTGALGVARPRNTPSLHEVPGQAWADLTEEGGAWGVAVLADRPGGWDHPHKHVLRRTLVRTPFAPRRFPHQTLQDLGAHRFNLALASHRGDWCAADVPAMGERFRQPPLAFLAAPARGPLGKRWSFLTVEGGELAALKEHEEGGEWVARLFDASGRGTAPRLRFAAPVAACRTLDGVEDPLADAAVVARSSGETVEVARPAHRPVTVGVRLAAAPVQMPPPRRRALELPHDTCLVTAQGEGARGALAGGLSIPAELWPAELVVGSVPFVLATGGARHRQALSCRGQRLRLPDGEWDALRLLVAGGSEDEIALTLGLDSRATTVLVPSATAPLAVEDAVDSFGIGGFRVWRVQPGSRRQGEVAWCVDHAHDAGGRDVAYTPLCLFVVDVDVLGRVTQLELPEMPAALIVAATLSAGGGWARRLEGEDAE